MACLKTPSSTGGTLALASSKGQRTRWYWSYSIGLSRKGTPASWQTGACSLCQHSSSHLLAKPSLSTSTSVLMTPSTPIRVIYMAMGPVFLLIRVPSVELASHASKFAKPEISSRRSSVACLVVCPRPRRQPNSQPWAAPWSALLAPTMLATAAMLFLIVKSVSPGPWRLTTQVLALGG